jgi:LAO/AO transport system kinase
VRRRELAVDQYVHGVLAGDRAVLGRAISLIESSAKRHQQHSRDLLTQLTPKAGGATRVGITGVPGVGKSTFIEAFGIRLCEQGRRVAVLAVDPSSGVSGGSILGDKTRMAELSVRQDAFIRPSPSAGTLGGVASKTREAMIVCEAAGYDVVLVETVGVGQSETVVAGMTDFFLGLMLPGAGDELQGIKRGLLELVDMIAVNKADGDNVPRAKLAAREYRNALRYMHTAHGDDIPEVLLCSAVTGEGLNDIWSTIDDRWRAKRDSGQLDELRKQQALAWMWAMVDERLRHVFRDDAHVRTTLPQIEADVSQGRLPATRAAESLIDEFVRRLG